MALSVLVQCGFMILWLVAATCAQELESYFKDCRIGDERFDKCLRKALNEVRPLFKDGVPKYGVDKFDPFFAKSVKFKRGLPNANVNLLLKNVYESGWTNSKITHLKTDLKNNKMVYRQVFPDKRLNGEFEIRGNILGNHLDNAGTWNLSLTDYVQTTTLTRRPRMDSNGSLTYDNATIEADIRYESTKGLGMNFGDPMGLDSPGANALSQLVNSSWPVGILFMRNAIDEIVSAAFTDIFTKSFQYFPFEEMIH
ncbi:hypothetical protein PPYR_09312 [Photinus pyralis]|uniref:Hemolymph juvenile hormone binding protein n=1 Tax=Photinus pyralis TaxID=7054 RepID=A0A5N4ALW5_PHOPY|nr:uncharacterized protein LOC116172184 [Photinus pyralis]KAB0798319.1 hypothetical protein PPYR_09312 [Photinus pyralis]